MIATLSFIVATNIILSSRPKYDDKYYTNIISEIIPTSELVTHQHLLSWYRIIQKNNRPRSERILVMTQTNAKGVKNYYLIVMDRGITRQPKYWNINFVTIEFQNFKPYRKYNRLPTNQEIEDLLEYTWWQWEGIECKFGLYGKVEEKNWDAVFGAQSTFNFINKSYRCDKKIL